MYIESIQLRDWKGYVAETYDFPKPTKSKNVVLIGAENGYGKTSLLEALMLCLYGRDGLSNIPRATLIDGGQEKLDLSYDEFLRRAFHGCALESGRTSAAITVVLNDDGEQTEITRLWHFAGNGRHKSADEEVRVYVNGSPYRVGRLDDRGDAIRSFIAHKFVPVYLAPFFLFDGEQVQRLANKDMATQVKTGIEGLLGVRVLGELKTDLKDYAATRRIGTTQSGDETVEELQGDIRELNTKVRRVESAIKEIEPTLPGLKSAREGKVKQLTSVAGGNNAAIKDLYDQKAQADARKRQLQDKLLEFLKADLALAMTGKPLRDATLNRLLSEDSREAWESGKSQGQEKLHLFQKSVVDASKNAQPPFSQAQSDWLETEIESAWESLWYPPPSNVADSYWHNSISGKQRMSVIERVERVNALALGDIQLLLDDLSEAEQDILRSDARIRELSGVADHVRKLTDEIGDLTRREQEASSRIQESKRELEALRAQLNNKNADLRRVAEQLGRSRPALQKAQRAQSLTSAIDSMLQEMYPLKVGEVAAAMSRIYKKLAHKHLLDRVEITDDCEVLLLDKQGNDLRRFDASAGENQIFAVALISAIAEVSGAEVPMVVDTPLARLDTRHRMNVLEHLAQYRGQVIFLSATDEVSGPYLEAIESKVGAGFHLDYEELDSGIGWTQVKKGYWEAAR